MFFHRSHIATAQKKTGNLLYSVGPLEFLRACTLEQFCRRSAGAARRLQIYFHRQSCWSSGAKCVFVAVCDEEPVEGRHGFEWVLGGILDGSSDPPVNCLTVTFLETQKKHRWIEGLLTTSNLWGFCGCPADVLIGTENRNPNRKKTEDTNVLN